MKLLEVNFFVLSLLIFSGCQKILNPSAYVANERARKGFQDQNFQEVQDNLVDALKAAPFQSELHLNLGLQQELSKENEKALNSYRNAQKYSSEGSRRFYSTYNVAQMLGKEKKIDEALAEYQSALEIYPASKEIKHNIELLIQMQQSNGQGQSDDKDKNKDKKQSQNDKENQSKDDKGKSDKDQKDKNDQQDKKYAENQKYKPRSFKGEDLSEGDVKKILGELKQQEQKIRAQFNRKQVKERPRDKDW